MARPQTDRDAVVEELFETANALLKERGPFGVTMTDVAKACGMSQSNIYRYFPSKEAMWEAFIERWFFEINEAMEEVVASELPPRDKLLVFFSRRLMIKRNRYLADPDLFRAQMVMGHEHKDVIQSYIDLGDHFLATIVGEAIAEGEFSGRKIDEVLPLINMMTAVFADPDRIVEHLEHTTVENLAEVITTIFEGLAEPVPAAARELATAA
jgi:AcrR family transcriptional regulator